jgi:hypothetical protein
MPHTNLLESSAEYDLITYDEAGVERTDDPDGRMSRRVLDFVEREAVSDLFLTCFGWEENVHSAKQRYDSWFRVMATAAGSARGRPGFRPLFVALHWPSRPWSDDEFEPAATVMAPSKEAAVETYGESPTRRRPAARCARSSGPRVEGDTSRHSPRTSARPTAYWTRSPASAAHGRGPPRVMTGSRSTPTNDFRRPGNRPPHRSAQPCSQKLCCLRSGSFRYGRRWPVVASSESRPAMNCCGRC